MNNQLTYEKLHKILNYDPCTGIWIWKVKPNRSTIEINDQAGVCGFLKIDGISYATSRLAWFYMEGYWPEYQIDHENRNRKDERWCNLRHLTPSCNCRNRGLMKNNKSGVAGVRMKGGKWDVAIKINKKQIHLGRYIRYYDAVKARWDAEVKYEYPNCNSSSTAYQYLNMKRIKA